MHVRVQNTFLVIISVLTFYMHNLTHHCSVSRSIYWHRKLVAYRARFNVSSAITGRMWPSVVSTGMSMSLAVVSIQPDTWGWCKTNTTRVAPNLTFSNSAEAEIGRISELKFSRSRSRIWLKLVFWSQNNTPVIKLMASTMLLAAIEAVHFSASFVALLFANYWQNL